MRASAVVALLCAGLASAAATTTSIKPGAVTGKIAPQQAAPSGCSPNYSGTFQIGPVNVSSTSKRSLHSRNTELGITLKDGVLTDPLGRTGYIASNQQFQFDSPPQAGAIWTSGFSICSNGSLALGNDAIWFSCLSGSFYNLYFESVGGQCSESYIMAYGVDGGHYVGPSVTPTGYSTTASTGSTTSSSTTTSTTSLLTSTGRNSTMTTTSTKKASNLTTTATGSSSSGGPFGTHPHGTLLTTAKPGVRTTQGSGPGFGGSSGNGGTSASTSTTGSGNAAPTKPAVGAVFGVVGGLAAFAAML